MNQVIREKIEKIKFNEILNMSMESTFFNDEMAVKRLLFDIMYFEV